jgi:uncharacterized protein DUF6941
MSSQPGRQSARPIVQGFLVCRQVFKDVLTGEFIVLGPTSHFRITGFPCKLPVMGFLQVVEAHGHYQFSASLLDPEEEQVWSWSAQESLYHPEPLIPHQIVFHDWVLNVPRPGRYRLELSANGQELVAQSLFLGPAELFRGEL